MIFLGKERDLSRQEPKDGEMLKADSCSLVPEEVGGEDLSLSLGFILFPAQRPRKGAVLSQPMECNLHTDQFPQSSFHLLIPQAVDEGIQQRGDHHVHY